MGKLCIYLIYGGKAMFLYNAARKVNSYIKQYKKQQNGKFLSPSRRIEFVAPPKNSKVVAMTFDDGPTRMEVKSHDNKGLTEVLVEILNKYGAKGTFDVIGTTEHNYPDDEGKLGDFTWSGVHFDHYPKFNDDKNAGVENCPELIDLILKQKHEITSHTYSHTLFGSMRAVYGKRNHFMTLDEVVKDLRKLDDLMKEKYNYKIKLSRPPHYIDKIPDGSNSYDAYRIMGYNYMAASFDGAGWQPLESYEKEVSAMINPLKAALEENPDSLNGKIIFQKDGCNMNLRTPVADALDMQLKLLTDYGYKVITVSELLELSPFEDVTKDYEEFENIKKLTQKGNVIGYRNNTFGPERIITEDEFFIMISNPEIFRVNKKLSYSDMVKIAKENAIKNGIIINKFNGNSLLDIALKKGVNTDELKLKDKNKIKRIEAIDLIFSLSEMI